MNTKETKTTRAFVALALPDNVKEDLGKISEALGAETGDAVRWVDPSTMHLTIRFLGDIEATQTGDVIQALTEPGT